MWWMRLGIVHERIEPGHPEQNGQHERMHRTLKAETTRPAGQHSLEQQERFDAFREEYNNERPHEVLDGKAPAKVYAPSPRPFPEKLADPVYPLHDDTLLVDRSGHIRVPMCRQAFLATALAGQLVGLSAQPPFAGPPVGHSERLASQIISLPASPTLAEAEVDQVCARLLALVA